MLDKSVLMCHNKDMTTTGNLKELFVDMIDLEAEITRVRNLKRDYLDGGHTESFLVAAERENVLREERRRRIETGSDSI